MRRRDSSDNNNMTIQRRDVTPLLSSAFQYDSSADLNTNMTPSNNSMEDGWNTLNNNKNTLETSSSEGHSSNLYGNGTTNVNGNSNSSSHLSMDNRGDDEIFHVNVSSANVGKYKEEMRKRRILSGGGCSRMCNYFVDKAQSIYLPTRLSSYLPVNTSPSSDSASHHHHHLNTGRVPLFHGIDKVVNGTRPASEMVSICGIKPLRYFWYMLSGGECHCLRWRLCHFYWFTTLVESESFANLKKSNSSFLLDIFILLELVHFNAMQYYYTHNQTSKRHV